MRAARGRQQLAEHAVGRFGSRGDDQRVARPADLDRGMDHQIVAGLTRYSDRRRRHARRQINRAHVRTHQTRAALRFVYGGDALKTELFDQLGSGARYVANNLMLHAYPGFSSDYIRDDLRVDALERLRVNDLRIAGIAPALRAAPFGDVGVVVPQMSL